MSDTVDDIGFEGRQLLNKMKTDSLRERMRSFIAENENRDLKTARAEVSKGKNLSEIVKEDREERF